MYVRSKKLCFSPTIDTSKKTCFGRYDEVNKLWINDGDPYLQRWDKTIISFKAPPALPPRGTLMLLLTNEEQRCYGSAGCVDLPVVEEVELGDFTTTPRIDEILEVATGQPARSIVGGTMYEIRGALFGADPHAVSFGAVTQGRSGPKYTVWTVLSSLDIQSWSDQSIVFTPSATPDITGGVKVNNSVVDSNVVAVSGEQASSGSGSSQPQASSSSGSPTLAATFPDVPTGHAYEEAIGWAKREGVLQGYPDGTFRPNNILHFLGKSWG